MFNTLRRVNSSDSSFIIETNDGPFNKRDQTKFARLACLHCRSKKLKCTGEKGGCQRCQDKRLPCSYIDASKSKSSSTSKHHEAKTTTESANRNNATDSSAHVSSPSDNMSANMMGTSSNGAEDAAACDFIDADFDFMMPGSFGAGSSIGAAVPPLDCFPELFPNTVTNFPSSDSLDFTSPTQFDGGSDNNSAEIGLNHGCYCHDILRTYEMVEIYLVWMPHDSSRAMWLGAEEMLRCQKEVLETCRSRLQCKICRFKSHDGMMIISICEKLLASIILMKRAYDGAQEKSLYQQQSASAPRKRSFIDAQSASSSLDDQIFLNKQELALRNGGSSRSRTGHRSNQSLDFGYGEWKIDDEDKLHVLKSLLRVRMGKLKDLISELEEVVTPHRWLVHMSMIRSLVERMDKNKTLETP